MWTSQVYGHHDKMARTKTHRLSQNTEYTNTRPSDVQFIGFQPYYLSGRYQIQRVE